MRNKIVSSAEAAAIIRTGDTVSISGFVGIGTPDELLIAIEQRFLETREPAGLTLVFAAAPGDGKDRGLNRLAHEGLIKRAVGGHWSLVPKLGRLALDNKIEAYNLPLGCISQLYRDIAGKRAGLLSRVGLRTFVDPRQDGGKINSVTTEDLVELVEMAGREWLFYKAFPINVTLIRGTTADVAGNITMEREALTLDSLSAAMAAKNSGGFVIAQVERIAAAGSLDPRKVQVPGILVDCVVLAEPDNHRQTYATPHSAAFSGQLRVPLDRVEPMPLDERKIIARRAALELPPGGVVNLGIGMPEGVAAVAAEENVLQYLTLDRRARHHRRHAAERAEFRRRAEPRGADPAEPAIRFLRRRRPRSGLPGHGAGRCRGQRQRQPLRRPPGRGRRLHQHQPERAQAGVHRQLHRRRPEDRCRRRPTAHPAGRPIAQIHRGASNRSPSAGFMPPRPVRRCST